MKSEFIPYEQAQSMQELGFDKICLNYYTEAGDNVLLQVKPVYCSKEGIGAGVLAPLYQQVFDWFREKHGLTAIISYKPNIKRWDFITYDMSIGGRDYPLYYALYHKRHKNRAYNTYEEARLDCIIELIETVKNK